MVGARNGDHLRLERAGIDLQPGRRGVLLMGLDDRAEDGGGLEFGAHRDDVARLYEYRRDGDAAAVDHEEAMAGELARLQAGHRESCAVDDIIETALEELFHLFTGLARSGLRLGIDLAELALGKTVDVAHLLLLQQLLGVFRLLPRAGFRVFTRPVGLPLENLVVLVAAVDVAALAADFPCFGTVVLHRMRNVEFGIRNESDER